MSGDASDEQTRAVKELTKEISSLNAGLFDAGAASEAIAGGLNVFSRVNNSDLNSVVSSALETRTEEQRRQVFAEVSRALMYDGEQTDVANEATVTHMYRGPDGGGDYEEGESGGGRPRGKPYGTLRVGEIVTNSIDYRKEIGEVSTLGTSRTTVEERLEQERAGTSSASMTSVMLPSMDSINEYLTVSQAKRMDDMVALLTQIRDNTSRSYAGSVVNALGGGTPPVGGHGVRSIATDFVRGFWDLTFPDNSSGAVTTEGRGGSS